MANFDTTSKKQVETDPQDFVQLCFGFEEKDITLLEVITPEQPTVEMHQADSLIKTIYKGNEVLVHFEFQVNDSYDPEMSLRMAGYIMRAIETYRLPVYSNVIYLRPDAGRNDPGRFEQNIEHHNVSIEYRVFRLIDLDGQKILDAKITGLVPFTPLMGHPTDIDAVEWFRHCVKVADSLDVPNKTAYLANLSILGNLVCDSQTIMDIILEETMQYASIIEHMAPQAHELGKAEGKAEGTRKHILEILAIQFGDDTAQDFKPTIESIDDLQRLEALFRAALQAEHEDEFKIAINDTNENHE